ncbi:MAG: hypothetical protein E6G47_07250 [Actinobacteria bacterium]|nr:MAG: hypothetical protein E6G47_07250 [Actinomycetota bacterium]
MAGDRGGRRVHRDRRVPGPVVRARRDRARDRAGPLRGRTGRRLGNRILLDLPGTVARILKERGVRRTEDAGLCTACETRRFFSHRRDGVTGRQALLALRLA